MAKEEICVGKLVAAKERVEKKETKEIIISEDSAQVDKSIERFEDLGLVEKIEKDTVCCYAKQDKVWVQSPDDAPWEFYTVLADSPTFYVKVDGAEGSACCS